MNARQAAFVREYLCDLNATQAAIRAGYAAASAHVRASRLLATPKVSAAIATLQADRAARLDVTADNVVRELARLAFSSIARAASWTEDTVQFVPSDQLDDDTAHAIAAISYESRTVGEETRSRMRLRLHSKLEALAALAKYLGLFNGAAAPAAHYGTTQDYVTDVTDVDTGALLLKIRVALQEMAAADGTLAPAEP